MKEFKIMVDGEEKTAELVTRLYSEELGLEYIYYYIKEENDNDDTEKELYASRIISEDDEHDKIIPITNEDENKIAFKMFSTMYNKVSNEVGGE